MRCRLVAFGATAGRLSEDASPAPAHNQLIQTGWFAVPEFMQFLAHPFQDCFDSGIAFALQNLYDVADSRTAAKDGVGLLEDDLPRRAPQRGLDAGEITC